MRLVLGLLLLALLLVSPTLLGGGSAPALTRVAAPCSAPSLVHDVKFVCGMTDEGFKCRRESGAIRRGKAQKVPGSSSDESSGGLFGGSDDTDALPPASDDASSGAQSPQAVPTTCPTNSELLGGHCIPYTQTCRTGLAANAAPQACQNAEEKLVCNFRSDGLKDCCCRTYSKF